MRAKKENMKRTILLVALLLVIVGVVIVMAGKKNNSSHTFDDYEGSFAIEDIDQVSRIVLQNGRKYTIELTKTANGWMVNDTYKARMSSVTPLLDAIQHVNIKYIPPKAAEESILWDIAAHGVQVDVFNRNGVNLKSYFVAGSNADESGTHILMNGSSQPFVVQIPSMDGSIRARFVLTLDEWRDRHFLNFDPDDVQTVDVEYHRQQSQSFRLSKDGRKYSVNPMHPTLRTYPDNYREGTSEIFLRALSNAACESFKNNYPFVDSIRRLQPFSTVQVTFKNDTSKLRLNIYPNGQPVYSEYTGPVHRLFIDVMPGDFLGAQYQVIKGFLRGYDFFFEGTDQELIF
jgi:uncharacterized protein DUF4340